MRPASELGRLLGAVFGCLHAGVAGGFIDAGIDPKVSNPVCVRLCVCNWCVLNEGESRVQ